MSLVDLLMSLDEADALIITAFVSLFVSIIVSIIIAVYTQHSAYKQTVQRDERIYYRDAYQKLYNPIISDVYYFLEVSAKKAEKEYPYYIEDGDTELIFDKIISHIDQEIIYATSELISARYRLKQAKIRNSYDKEPRNNLSKIYLLFVFMNDLSDAVDRSGIFNKSSKQGLEKFRFLYAVWYLMTGLGGYNADAKGILLIREMIWIKEEEASMEIYRHAEKKVKEGFRGEDMFEVILKLIATKTYAKRPGYINVDALIQEARQIDEENPDLR